MNRTEFEALRDVAGKVVRSDIRLSKRVALAPALVVDGIVIDNADKIDLRMNITYNPETSSKTFNVYVPGIGPICRLDIDGPVHRPCGRSHKHSLQSDRCPERNLPDAIVDRPDLSGVSLREAFDVFCKMANISFVGNFESPDKRAP